MTRQPKSRELIENAPESQENSRFPDGFRILQGSQEYITYQERSSIRIWPSNVPGSYERHVHSAVEILLPHRGVSVVELPDAIYHVAADEVLIIPAGCPHSLTEGADILRHLLLFEPTVFLNLRDMASLSALLSRPIHLKGGTALQKDVAELLMCVVSCYFKKEPMWNTQCYSYLLQVYMLLGRDYLQSEPMEEQKELAPIEPDRKSVV